MIFNIILFIKMDSYSNKINRIKYTIDEIRDDIEKMKMVQ